MSKKQEPSKLVTIQDAPETKDTVSAVEPPVQPARKNIFNLTTPHDPTKQGIGFGDSH